MARKPQAWLPSARSFTPYSETITATGTDTILIPPGATVLTVECIGGGGRSGGGNAGGGAEYAKRNTYSVIALSGVYISVAVANTGSGNPGDPTFVRENNSGGTVICRANGGSNGGLGSGAGGSGGTGDVLHSGGAGKPDRHGGGAGGPVDAGASGSSGGASGGPPAGAGGTDGHDGEDYGGGAGAGNHLGGQGWLKLSWA